MIFARFNSPEGGGRASIPVIVNPIFVETVVVENCGAYTYHVPAKWNDGTQTTALEGWQEHVHIYATHRKFCVREPLEEVVAALEQAAKSLEGK